MLTFHSATAATPIIPAPRGSKTSNHPFLPNVPTVAAALPLAVAEVPAELAAELPDDRADAT